MTDRDNGAAQHAAQQGEALPDEINLALAYTPQRARSRLRVVFEFDARLGRIIAATTEPMLGQLRLAWWRDTLAQPAHERPAGDAVLDAIGAHLSGHEAALIALVDGWEHMLDEPPFSETAALAFAAGRSAALAAAFVAIDRQAADGPIQTAAMRWSLADLAAKVSHAEERAVLVRLGLSYKTPKANLPRDARGIAVLGALASRALENGGRPLMEGRGAALVALRVGLFGR